MVSCDLLDAASADFVQPRVSDMANRRGPILKDDRGENTGHSVPFGATGTEPVNLIVRDGDGFSKAIGNRACLAFKTFAHHRQRDVRGLAAGRLATDTVDDDEHTTRLIDVIAILVHVALKARV